MSEDMYYPYIPLEIVDHEVVGMLWALDAMRLPKMSQGDTIYHECDCCGFRDDVVIGVRDLRLASALVKGGDDHAKAIGRGIIVYMKIKFQVGWLIEFETYRHGVECLSTSSSMHIELKELKGVELAQMKQKGLVDKVYVRILHASYQALRHMYKARRHHRHPDWAILCNWIEGLPYSKELITV